ncbi:hypothetical protein RvY_08223 [Ramazzottius varieornatus]|uniref:Uncharacterized protein n=1 Tax=Ramazzottius varieornatus TaxID=947166 RepID=A0A1D1V7U2_RAMVA|nr:hypothetical protein RvY_08223 [Ramazzottius varieornatus]
METRRSSGTLRKLIRTTPCCCSFSYSLDWDSRRSSVACSWKTPGSIEAPGKEKDWSRCRKRKHKGEERRFTEDSLAQLKRWLFLPAWTLPISAACVVDFSPNLLEYRTSQKNGITIVVSEDRKVPEKTNIISCIGNSGSSKKEE